MALTIEPVACLRDNYAYLIFDPSAADPTCAWVVDPSEAGPVRKAVTAAGLRLVGALATHHHHDHVGGIAELADDTPGFRVFGFESDAHRIPKISDAIQAPTETFVDTGHTICGMPLEAMHIPGHTTGAVAWKLADQVFTGDTLFAAGCGYLFEGTPAMMHSSLRAICSLPQATQLWFGHEYTANNLRFAAVAEPDNAQVQRRAASLPARTTPTTVALELATNPFVRAATSEVFAERRNAKNKF